MPRCKIEDDAELTPEQDTKMQLLELVIMYDKYLGYWVWNRVHGNLLITHGGVPAHYWPTADEAIRVAANPAKYGLKWKV